jgi:hypothetical protein
VPAAIPVGQGARPRVQLHLLEVIQLVGHALLHLRHILLVLLLQGPLPQLLLLVPVKFIKDEMLSLLFKTLFNI